MVLQTEFAQIKNNNLYIDDVKATELAKKYGSTLYVMSEGHIRHQFNKLKSMKIHYHYLHQNHFLVLQFIKLLKNMVLESIVYQRVRFQLL